MTVSVLLRLVPGALRAGRIAGEVELIDSGERLLVREVGELVAFLQRAAGGENANDNRTGGDEHEEPS